ncbi:MAG: hypothetical protein KatS3mg131_3030 [Candidatus Tectimicrobiota bacterium]|nr:MAG: hypothetical protein KatS3mg131_3030 [Candidatus Tectomicrobia bacterium]
MLQTHVLVVSAAPHVPDVRGQALCQAIREDLGLPVEAVRTAFVYTIHTSWARAELEEARRVLFTDAIVQTSYWNRRPPEPCHWIVQVGLLPGVTDNVGRTATEALADIYRRPLPGAVYASSLYLLRGALAYSDVERLVRELLANPLIHQWRITAAEAWHDDPQAFLPPPVAGEEKPPQVATISLADDDAALLRLSEARLLALNLEEMQAIRAYFRDPAVQARRRAYGLGGAPTDVELECPRPDLVRALQAQDLQQPPSRTTTANGGVRTVIRSLFQHLHRRAPPSGMRRGRATVDMAASRCFTDNAGVITFNDRLEPVRSRWRPTTPPRALDPYAGALTGILGVNRDPLGTGMRLPGCIFNADVLLLCADPFYEERPAAPPPAPQAPCSTRACSGASEHGANQSGIPHRQRLPWSSTTATSASPSCSAALAGPHPPARLGGRAGPPQARSALATAIVMAGGPHRQGRHPRRHLLLRVPSTRRQPGLGGAARRPLHPEAKALRLSPRSPATGGSTPASPTTAREGCLSSSVGEMAVLSRAGLRARTWPGPRSSTRASIPGRSCFRSPRSA